MDGAARVPKGEICGTFATHNRTSDLPGPMACCAALVFLVLFHVGPASKRSSFVSPRHFSLPSNASHKRPYFRAQSRYYLHTWSPRDRNASNSSRSNTKNNTATTGGLRVCAALVLRLTFSFMLSSWLESAAVP